ncbi:MAG: PKD domain-containing protein, partial [Prolixibacteraceae bacterium]|nr:PKD domain-containing protein [Prolixibacteraceae bacterium]
SKPDGSNSQLSNSYISKPSFTPDVFGTYKFSLLVNNGAYPSEPDVVVITVVNELPIANAGIDQEKLVGEELMLNGSSSYDPEGSALSYLWTILEIPENSEANITNLEIINPVFIADVVGTYRFSLVVYDGTSSSLSDEIEITISENELPIANAGVNFETMINEEVELDASNSYDPEAMFLTYYWSEVSKPSGSNAVLSSNTAKQPTLSPDVEGDYIFSLTVNDGVNTSATDEIIITAKENLAPIANAGNNQLIQLGQEVLVDGSQSYDPDGETLSFLWTFVTKPDGSVAQITKPTGSITNFTPDKLGLYTLRLDVSDGTLSTSDQVQITVEITDGVSNFNKDNSISLYPNPFQRNLNVAVNFAIEETVRFELYNLTGSLVKRFEFNGLNAGSYNLDFQDKVLKNGVYILKVDAQKGASKVFRIIHKDI